MDDNPISQINGWMGTVALLVKCYAAAFWVKAPLYPLMRESG